MFLLNEGFIRCERMKFSKLVEKLYMHMPDPVVSGCSEPCYVWGVRAGIPGDYIRGVCSI